MAQRETFDRIEQALLRKPAQNIAEGQVRSADAPDYERAQLQHAALTEALKKCGVAVTTLNPDTIFPNGSFIGNIAVVTERLAVIGNFADTDPRQGEQQAAASVLAGSRFLKFISAPGRLDASDVLRLGNRFYIGLSARTNEEGAAQLAFFLKEFGYDASLLNMSSYGDLRLSAAAVYIGRDRLLVRAEMAQHYAFLEYDKIILSPEEKGAAGAFMANGTLILPQGFPRLREEMRFLEVPLIEVNVSEFEKTGGSLSCLALRLPAVEKGNIVLIEGWREKAG
jgi:dimethylargininase